MQVFDPKSDFACYLVLKARISAQATAERPRYSATTEAALYAVFNETSVTLIGTGNTS